MDSNQTWRGPRFPIRIPGHVKRYVMYRTSRVRYELSDNHHFQ